MTLEIDVRDLLAQPGTSRATKVSESIAGLGNELAAVPREDRVDVDLLLESVVEGVLVSGPVSGPLAMVCARCLISFRSEFRLDVHELFTPDAGVGDDQYPVNEGAIDLEPMIRDAVLLSMPFAPLCRPDCLGLCERCGGNRNLGECVCAPQVDPRWAPLSGIDLERVERRTGDRG